MPLTQVQSGMMDSTAQYYSFKNRIINGAMVIDQRNAGASVTPTLDATYTLDRWVSYLAVSSKYSVQQNAGSVTPPAGFSNYLGITSLSAYTTGASEYFGLVQFVEGFNFSDFAWGTASAAPATISFWVRSSLTGTFNVAFRNSAGNRGYLTTYTVSAANTWEYKTITIPGDTSGTWLTNNGIGIRIWFDLGSGVNNQGTAGSWSSSQPVRTAGSVSIVGTNGATFYITGVQLEKGSTATSFDYRPYGTELALCQRYLPAFRGQAFNLGGWNGQAYSTTAAQFSIPFPVATRVEPTGISISAAGDFRLYNATGGGLTSTACTYNGASTLVGTVLATVASGLVAGNATVLYGASSGTPSILFTGCEL